MKANLTKMVIIFIALTIAGVCLIVFGQGAASPAVSAVLPLVGTAIFASGMTYFMVKAG